MTAQQKGFIYTALSAVCFATGGLLIKLNTWSSMSINGMRSFFAFFIFLLYMKLTKHQFKFNWKVLLGVVANSMMGITFIMANKMTTAANAIVLQFTLPIYIMLLAWIFQKKKPDKVSVISGMISLVGIMFFFFESLSLGGMTGNVLALVSGFFYAIVFLIKQIPDSDFESSAIISFVLNFVIGIPFILQETDWGIMNMSTGVLQGVVQIGLAYIFLNVALDKVPPVGASLISMIEPILNPILVAIFYGEKIGKISFVGAIIVLASALFYNLRGTGVEENNESAK